MGAPPLSWPMVDILVYGLEIVKITETSLLCYICIYYKNFTSILRGSVT